MFLAKTEYNIKKISSAIFSICFGRIALFKSKAEKLALNLR